MQLPCGTLFVGKAHQLERCAVDDVTNPDHLWIGQATAGEAPVGSPIAVDHGDFEVAIKQPHDFGVVAVEWV